MAAFTFALLKLKLLNQDRICNIPTHSFNDILKSHLMAGWHKRYLYEGFDAWIDYGRVDLSKQGVMLKFEWNNWSAGRITGPSKQIAALAGMHQLHTLRQPLLPASPPH